QTKSGNYFSVFPKAPQVRSTSPVGSSVLVNGDAHLARSRERPAIHAVRGEDGGDVPLRIQGDDASCAAGNLRQAIEHFGGRFAKRVAAVFDTGAEMGGGGVANE